MAQKSRSPFAHSQVAALPPPPPDDDITSDDSGEPGQVIAFPVSGAEHQPPPDYRVGERMLAVVSMSDLTHAERSVLSVIAYHDGPGGAWPSLQTIADKVGLSRSRVSALVAEIERKGRLVRKKTQRTNLYTVHYELQVRPLKKTPRYDFSTCEIPEPENPAVSETVTAEIVDNSESCRLGNRDSAVSETETGTGRNRKVKTKGTDAAAVDQALSLKQISAAAAERDSALPKDFDVDLSLSGVSVNSDPSERERLTAETSRNAQAILKRRKDPKHSTAQSERKSKSPNSAKKPTENKNRRNRQPAHMMTDDVLIQEAERLGITTCGKNRFELTRDVTVLQRANWAFGQT